jgi:hypothetical protein
MSEHEHAQGAGSCESNGERGGDRTHGQKLKRLLLYH